MNKQDAAFLNSIIAKHKLVMMRFHKGRVYLLWNHYRFLDPEDAPIIFLCKGEPPKHTRASNRIKDARIVYVTEQVKWK